MQSRASEKQFLKRRVYRLWVERDRQPQAALAMLHYQVPWLPFGLLWAPRGPSLTEVNCEILRVMNEAVRELAGRRALYLLCNPYLPDDAINKKHFVDAGFQPVSSLFPVFRCLIL